VIRRRSPGDAETTSTQSSAKPLIATGSDVDTKRVDLFDEGLRSRLGTFRRDDRPDVPHLVVDGDVDDRLVDDFTDAIFKVVVDAQSTAVLDLTGVTHFGANGIGALITGKALAHDHGVELVVEPSRIVRRVLVIVGLADYFVLQREHA